MQQIIDQLVSKYGFTEEESTDIIDMVANYITMNYDPDQKTGTEPAESAAGSSVLVNITAYADSSGTTKNNMAG